ncbi:NACHT domain-containing protein [Embleya sp. NPDC055664]
MSVVWLVVWGSRGIQRGDIDWLSASIALPGLGVAVWSALMSRTALGLQAADLAALGASLADRVALAETRERSRMLGGAGKPIDVRFVFRPGHVQAHDAAGADPDGRLGTVVDYYRRLRPGRLVITGPPGSGKTVLALELLLALIEDRDPRDPVPVRMPLGSWTALDTTPIDEGVQGAEVGDALRVWVIDHLQSTYRLPRAAARLLVEANMILPILDGLDEMDAADFRNSTGPSARPGRRARRALEIMNAYQHGRDRACLVVTSRSDSYDALNTWAKDAARIDITPVTPGQAREFILARVDDPRRWRDVVDALASAPSGPLARGLSTPWRLTMAVAVHEQRDRGFEAYSHAPRNLLAPDLADDATMRDHLHRLYVRSRTCHVVPRGHSQTPEQAHVWLGVLARYLEDNSRTGRIVGGRTLSGTDLVLHELWPLAGDSRAYIAHLRVVAASTFVAIAVAVAVCLIDSSPLLILRMGQPFSLVCGAMVITGIGTWPRRAPLAPARLRTARGQHRIRRGVVAGLMLGTAFAIVGWFENAPMSNVMASIAVVVGVAVLGGITTALAGGIRIRRSGVGVSVKTIDDDGGAARDPRDLIRAELTTAIVLGLVTGLLLGNDVDLELDSGSRAILGFGLGILFGLVCAPAGLRYAIFLLYARTGPHRLPWRLGRFLHWATQAGLLRTAGTAYQFRHRELQDWLARNPTP